MPIIRLKPSINNCFLRGGPLQLAELRTRQPIEKWLCAVGPNETVAVEKECQRKGDFVQYKLTSPIAGENYWWVWAPHFELPKQEAKNVPVVGGDGLPARVKLSVRHLSQLDNVNRPHGTCNVTSLATVMVFYGHPAFDNTGKQLEDQLFELCERKGLDRHNHWHLKQLIEGFGYKDNYQEDAKWVDVKRHIAGGNPCICAGFFSRSGHILVLTGYDETGFVVSDPYGVWYYQEDGNHYYDTSRPGDGVVYPYSEMREVCGRDGDLWIHYVSK